METSTPMNGAHPLMKTVTIAIVAAVIVGVAMLIGGLIIGLKDMGAW